MASDLITTPTLPSVARCGGRVETVHSLRGLAALAVAFFHFSNGNPNFYVPPVLRAIGANGWLGVEVFFVISGFILPYSLWRAGYQLSPSNFGRFVWKRVVRLDPPYFGTIALVLLLAYLSHFPQVVRSISGGGERLGGETDELKNATLEFIELRLEGLDQNLAVAKAMPLDGLEQPEDSLGGRRAAFAFLRVQR